MLHINDGLHLSGMAGCLAIAALIGLINGFMAGHLKVNALLSTLSTGILTLGAARVLTRDQIVPLIEPSPVLESLPRVALIMLAAGFFIAIAHLRRRACKSPSPGESLPYTLGIYLASSVSAALAGLLHLQFFGSGHYIMGLGFESDVLLAALLGGRCLKERSGSVLGIMGGVAFIILGKYLFTLHEAYESTVLLVKGFLLVALLLRLICCVAGL